MQVYNGVESLGGIEQEPNIYLVDGDLLVDCGTGFLFTQLKDYIESHYESYKIKALVNTHCHFDNAGATKKVRDWLKAKICMHVEDKGALESGEGMLAEFFDERPKIVTIDKPLKDGVKIRTSNFNFEVVHTPGHTPGSICLYEKDRKILISGDTIFDEKIGRTDLLGGDSRRMLMSLNRLLDYEVQYLLPGHGPPKIGGFSFHVKQMIQHFGQKRFINYDFY